MDSEIAQLRLPPHSIEAEQSVLGGLLLNNGTWEDIADIITDDDFYRHDHRMIWQHISNLLRAGRPADALTVKDALQQSGRLEDAGGEQYLAMLSNAVISASNIRHYAEMVRDRAVLRRLIAVSDQIATEAFNAQGRPVNEVLDAAEAEMFKIAEDSGKKRNDFQHIGPLSGKVFQRIDELYNRDNPSEITGIATGFVDLDRMTSGMQPGDLIIVAARPSVGKTAFALNIGEHVAVHEKLPVAVFSMEMGAEQLVMRLIGSTGRIDQQRLRTGRLTEDDFIRLTDAMGKMQDAPMFIDETPALNPFELRARARRLARQYGHLGLIVIDYLQLMTGANPGGRENRATEVGEISRALKSLAKELKCPVIALSQLSREVEKRQDKKPIMSDLRESGSIEQDADVIFFILTPRPRGWPRSSSASSVTARSAPSRWPSRVSTPSSRTSPRAEVPRRLLACAARKACPAFPKENWADVASARFFVHPRWLRLLNPSDSGGHHAAWPPATGCSVRWWEACSACQRICCQRQVAQLASGKAPCKSVTAG